jgi:hypothetical protein
MGPKYQRHDFPICNYELYSPPGAPDLLRGPSPRRQPDYALSCASLHRLWGGFPMLLDAKTLARISGHSVQLVTSLLDDGQQVPLIDRFTGRPTSVLRDERILQNNNYHPSQAMHIQASLTLRPEIAARLRPRV